MTNVFSNWHISGWRKGITTLAVIAFMITLAMGVLTTPAGAAEHATDAGLSGSYAGRQDGEAFRMELVQDGGFLTGWVAVEDGQRDPLYGIVNGDSLAMVRASNPLQIWQGRIALPEIGGTWFGPGGHGEWHAAKIAPALRIEKTVRPGVIRAGSSTKVLYQIVVKNAGHSTAHDVVLTDAHLPSFFQLESIDIDRSFDGGDAPAHSGDTIVLPLGDIPAGGTVVVRIEGTATPREAGTFVNVATVTASNQRAVHDRAALWVVESCLTDVRSLDASFSDVRPTDSRSTDLRAARLTTDIRPCTDVAPTDVRPTDVRPTDVRPTDVRPTDVRPTDVRDILRDAVTPLAQ